MYWGVVILGCGAFGLALSAIWIVVGQNRALRDEIDALRGQLGRCPETGRFKKKNK